MADMTYATISWQPGLQFLWHRFTSSCQVITCTDQDLPESLRSLLIRCRRLGLLFLLTPTDRRFDRTSVFCLASGPLWVALYLPFPSASGTLNGFKLSDPPSRCCVLAVCGAVYMVTFAMSAISASPANYVVLKSVSICMQFFCSDLKLI